ncbi:MAG: hypothetical protein OEY38_05945 [Gammaproteobacteria bacterium]|nr:hypothetical protein [Gammaproteobacteria bacterium]
MRKIKEYSNFEDIIKSVSDHRDICGIYTGEVTKDYGPILTFFYITFAYYVEEYMAFFITFALVALFCRYLGFQSGVELVAFVLALSSVFVVVSLKLKPSLTIVTPDKVYLIKNIRKNKKSMKYFYNSIEISKRKDVAGYFKLSKINPIYNLLFIPFKMNSVKYVIRRHPFTSYLFDKYYSNYEISFGELKKLIYRSGDPPHHFRTPS